MARILIVGGGCRGRELAGELAASGHAVRITTRSESGRAAIEASRAECFIGTPDRLGTLRDALDGITIACWLLAGASGGEDEVARLHSSRLEAFVSQLIDTTARGLVFERGASAGRWSEALADGERVVRDLAEQNVIPLAVLADDIRDSRVWLRGARTAIHRLLGE
jgi:uncharacterized protein YbjT (DUF2867 family)